MCHVIDLRQSRGIKSVTLKAAKRILQCRGLIGRVIPGGNACPMKFVSPLILASFQRIQTKRYGITKYEPGVELSIFGLNTRLEHELGIANNWYERNGMIVNPEKHQAMVLGANSNYEFSFPVKNSIDLLGVTIDKDLSFNRHISQICEKVNKQFSVLKRFKNIITSNVMLRLYKAFILPHFQYCSLIWHFSGTRNCDKLESLNKRILRFIFNDSLSSYDELLKKAKIASLYTGRLHKILVVVFKSLFVPTYPGYLKELFVFRNSSYSLRGKNILTLPIPRTTNYGLECIRYQAAKIWNSLPDSMRIMTSFKDFKKAIKEMNF